ncbi:MAG: PfkB family carbohydrate kinase, partial [Halorhabdus sp.]
YETTKTLLETDTTTGFDLNYRSKLWTEATAQAAYDDLLPAVDVLFAPERDARSILGVDGDAASIAGTLRTRYDCETVVVTRGADGATASTAETTVEQPAFDTETLDPIGTGDAFVGAFLSQYVEDASIERALEYGAAAAALKRTIAGDVAVITEAEVEAVIDQSHGGISR